MNGKCCDHRRFVSLLGCTTRERIHVIPRVRSPKRTHTTVISVGTHCGGCFRASPKGTARCVLDRPRSASHCISMRCCASGIVGITLPSACHFVRGIVRRLGTVCRRTNLSLSAIRLNNSRIPHNI